MMKYDYLVVGGGLAGGKALAAIRKLDTQGSVALIAREPRRPYERPPLSKSVLRGEAPVDSVYLEDADYYPRQEIQIFSGLSAVRLDPEEHQLELEDQRIIEYGKLLLATGGRAIELDLPGVNLRKVFTLRRLEDSLAIHDAVQQGTRVLVLGGSFIGCEVAASLAQLGGDVLQVFPESRLLESILPEAASHYLEGEFADRGIEVRPGTVAKEIRGKDSVERVLLADGDVHAADVVVMGVGIKLNTELARQAGLELREEDQAIVVDRQLRTSQQDIYAAGDIAAWPSDRFGGLLRVEHWDVARRQGSLAGRNMAGRQEAYQALPYFFSDLFDLSFEVWGNLSSWDRSVVRGSFQGKSFAIGYFWNDRLVGILACGRPDKERDPMQALVAKGPTYGEISPAFRDESQELGLLIHQIP